MIEAAFESVLKLQYGLRKWKQFTIFATKFRKYENTKDVCGVSITQQATGLINNAIFIELKKP